MIIVYNDHTDTENDNTIISMIRVYSIMIMITLITMITITIKVMIIPIVIMRI